MPMYFNAVVEVNETSIWNGGQKDLLESLEARSEEEQIELMRTVIGWRVMGVGIRLMSIEKVPEQVK